MKILRRKSNWVPTSTGSSHPAPILHTKIQAETIPLGKDPEAKENGAEDFKFQDEVEEDYLQEEDEASILRMQIRS